MRKWLYKCNIYVFDLVNNWLMKYKGITHCLCLQKQNFHLHHRMHLMTHWMSTHNTKGLPNVYTYKNRTFICFIEFIPWHIERAHLTQRDYPLFILTKTELSPAPSDSFHDTLTQRDYPLFILTKTELSSTSSDSSHDTLNEHTCNACSHDMQVMQRECRDAFAFSATRQSSIGFSNISDDITNLKMKNYQTHIPTSLQQVINKISDIIYDENREDRSGSFS